MNDQNQNQNQVESPQSQENNPGPKGIDWPAAFKFYCTPKEDGTLPSYQDVSNKFGVNVRNVELKGSEDLWVKQREDIGKTATEQFKKSVVDNQDVANREHLDAWKKAKFSALSLLNFFNQEVEEYKKKTLPVDQALENTTVGGDSLPHKKKSKKSRAPSPWRLQAIVEALKTAINGERIVLGMPTEISRATVDQITRYAELSPEEIAEMDAMYDKVTKTPENESPNQPTNQ